MSRGSSPSWSPSPCIFIATSLSAAVLAFPDLHQMRKAALAPAGLFALFVAIMFFAWRADVPPAPLPVHSFECTVSITLFSLLPAAWTFFSMRKFASTHYRWAGSIALLSAFSVGALWLRLHEAERLDHPRHPMALPAHAGHRPCRLVAGETVVEMVVLMVGTALWPLPTLRE